MDLCGHDHRAQRGWPCPPTAGTRASLISSTARHRRKEPTMSVWKRKWRDKQQRRGWRPRPTQGWIASRDGHDNVCRMKSETRRHIMPRMIRTGPRRGKDIEDGVLLRCGTEPQMDQGVQTVKRGDVPKFFISEEYYDEWKANICPEGTSYCASWVKDVGTEYVCCPEGHICVQGGGRRPNCQNKDRLTRQLAMASKSTLGSNYETILSYL